MTRAEWAQAEISLLRKHYGTMPNADLARMIGKSKQGLQHKAHRMGLTTKKVATYKYCIDCGKKLSRAAIYNEKACRCVECARNHRSGENHHNWRGGVSELRSIVHCLLKPLWIYPIMQRDNYTCQICNKRGGDLEVHHLRPYHSIRDRVLNNNPHLNIDNFEDRKRAALLIVEDHELDDGITLCARCHYELHNQNRGELLENRNASGDGNQQPSRSNVVSIVDRKVQRLTGEDTQTNKPDTSAPDSDTLTESRYSLSCMETCRNRG
jgi:hypothetical protein